MEIAVTPFTKRGAVEREIELISPSKVEARLVYSPVNLILDKTPKAIRREITEIGEKYSPLHILKFPSETPIKKIGRMKLEAVANWASNVEKMVKEKMKEGLGIKKKDLKIKYTFFDFHPSEDSKDYYTGIEIAINIRGEKLSEKIGAILDAMKEVEGNLARCHSFPPI